MVSCAVDRTVRLLSLLPGGSRSLDDPWVDHVRNVCIMRAARTLSGGKVDAHRTLAEAEAERSDHFVLDLGGTRYCDVRGLGLILTLKKALESEGKEFRICGVSRALRLQMSAQRVLSHLEGLFFADPSSAAADARSRQSTRCEISAREEEGALRVNVSGELSLDTVERIDVDQLLPADYGGEFLLDLENVEFIDSIGLRTVLEMKNRLAEPSRHRIKVKKGKVKSMIAQTGLDEELNVEAR